ncbi:hypothetical protein E2C01_042150 [Portunus trituberculatus]|uniref:Uncharacterized protein n=1 Tax=Portunus trituberculatus TaxID=210409 RepID=A0A5B7FSW8_PORTR|nr:hypothetical protein [Portunus trituberculatus]
MLPILCYPRPAIQPIRIALRWLSPRHPSRPMRHYPRSPSCPIPSLPLPTVSPAYGPPSVAPPSSRPASGIGLRASPRPPLGIVEHRTKTSGGGEGVRGEGLG